MDERIEAQSYLDEGERIYGRYARVLPPLPKYLLGKNRQTANYS